MKITQTAIPEVLVLEPQVFEDDRGAFYESFNARRFAALTGTTLNFVQDNFSRSGRNVLRGMHYQVLQSQGKLVQVTVGEVFDVAVDLRRSSPSFGCWVGNLLSANNRLQHWIPPGFAHGFLVTSAHADLLYKATDYYAPEHERIVHWQDESIGVHWPLQGSPLLSAKDMQAGRLKNAELFD